MLKKGFTLVELLVVIAIIGLLSTVAVVALSSSRRQARNAKRIADVKQLVTAFNLGLDANGSYPSTGGDVWNCVSSICTGFFSYPANGTVDAFFQPFMPTKPTDPDDKNSRLNGGYLYNGASAVYGGFPVLNYVLEPPATCGAGIVVSTTSNYVQCIVTLN